MRDLLDFLLFRRGPRWLLPCLIAGTIAAVMPEMHYAVFGVERITQATIDKARAEQGIQMGDRGRQMLETAAREHSVPLVATVNFALVVVGIFLAGTALNIGLLILGGELSAGQALTVAAAASCGMALLQAMGWCVVVLLLSHDMVVAPDWGHVAKADASLFLPPTGPAVLRTAAASLDLVRLIGVALATIGVRMFNHRIGIGVALTASAVWFLTGLLFRVAVASITGIALV